MSDFLLIGLFFFLVFAPCLLAFDEVDIEDERRPGRIFPESLGRPRPGGRMAAPLNASLAEATLSEDFVIRSFPKGLSQRRIVVRDTQSGVKLTIGQVRAAAAELIRISGRAAAYEFALVTAAAAAAMSSVKDAVEIAAREALDAARNAYAWFAWAEVPATESAGAPEWAAGPPLLEDLEPMPALWGERSWAA